MRRIISQGRSRLRGWGAGALVAALTFTWVAGYDAQAFGAVPSAAQRAVVAVPVAATEDATSAIAGRVTHDRVPVERLAVAAYEPGTTEAPSEDTEPPVAWTTTNAEGRFTLAVPAGDYQIHVYDSRRIYRDQWVGTDGTRAAATVLTAAAGETVSVEVTSVDLLRVVGVGGGTSGELWARRWDEPTRTWGELYQLTDRALFGWVIEPGRYRFLHHGVGLPTWYGDTLDFERAQDVVITPTGDPHTRLTINPIYANTVTALEPVELVGSGWVGEPLTFRDAAWNVAPSTWRHQVVRDDGEVLAENGPWTYTPRPADAGHTIVVRMFASRAGYNEGLSVSEPVLIQAVSATRIPKVAGKAQLGSALRATTGSWNQPVSGYAYQWTRSGRPIAGADRATYRVTRSDLGKKVGVRVTAITGEGRVGTATSATVRVRALASFTVTRTTVERAGVRVTTFKATLHLVGVDRVGGKFTVTGPQIRLARTAHDRAAQRWTTPATPGRYTYRVALPGSRLVAPAKTKVSAKVR
ncbi:MAG: hypothetical protein WBP61_18765 [Nocardioides sp.]